MLYSVLLAGGLSSRMGQDKRFLDIDGKTLLQHSLSLLEQAGSDKVLISGDVSGQNKISHDSSSYDNSSQDKSVEAVPDILTQCGPLGGLHAILHHIQDHYSLDDSPLLIIPVDMPLLEVRCLQQLVEGIGQADCIHYKDEIFPCVFRASISLLNYLDALFRDSRELGGDRSMKALLERGSEIELDTKGLPENIFMNLNRPQDLETVRQMTRK